MVTDYIFLGLWLIPLAIGLYLQVRNLRDSLFDYRTWKQVDAGSGVTKLGWRVLRWNFARSIAMAVGVLIGLLSLASVLAAPEHPEHSHGSAVMSAVAWATPSGLIFMEWILVTTAWLDYRERRLGHALPKRSLRRLS